MKAGAASADRFLLHNESSFPGQHRFRWCAWPQTSGACPALAMRHSGHSRRSSDPAILAVVPATCPAPDLWAPGRYSAAAPVNFWQMVSQPVGALGLKTIKNMIILKNRLIKSFN